MLLYLVYLYELLKNTQNRVISGSKYVKINGILGIGNVIWQEEPVSGVFALGGCQTIGPAPKTQEKGFYRGCPGTEYLPEVLCRLKIRKGLH
jgi:hypothetical protein